MKIYDKEMYDKQKSINMLLIILVSFFIGFACGYLANFTTSNHDDNTANNVNVTTKNEVYVDNTNNSNSNTDIEFEE